MKRKDCATVKAVRLHGLSALAMTTLLAVAFDTESAHGQAADSPANKIEKVTDLRGEWIRNEPGFACRVATGRLPEKVLTSVVLSRACQHIGPFVIGQDAKAVEAALGEPHREHAGAPGQTQLVYFLGQRDHYPYLVATVAKERIVALQLTGPAAAEGYSFNHVELGATTDTLVSYFGQPNHVEPSELKDTELWAYRPWPFAFEVKDGHVTSIRISEP